MSNLLTESMAFLFLFFFSLFSSFHPACCSFFLCSFFSFLFFLFFFVGLFLCFFHWDFSKFPLARLPSAAFFLSLAASWIVYPGSSHTCGVKTGIRHQIILCYIVTTITNYTTHNTYTSTYACKIITTAQ